MKPESTKNKTDDHDQKYMTFFHKSVDAMLIIEGHFFVDCNQAAMSMLKYDHKEEMLNRHPSKLSPEFQPDGKKSYEKAMEMMTIAYEKGAHFFEWDHKRKNGEVFPVEVSLTTISSGKKKVLHTVWRDISSRKKAEAERNKLEEQLHRSQKMEAIGLMAGGVAHDLNNILSGIVTYPDLLLMSLPKDSDLQEIVKEIQESGRRAADVVADLLVVARGITTVWETSNLNILITQYLASPEGRKVKSLHPHVTIATNLSPDLLNISCSGVHIKKCLMNLVMNAAENIKEAGSVTISTRNRYIDKPVVSKHLEKKGEYAVLTVTDTGSGIAKKDINHIFEPFYTKKVLGKSGTGLGLAIVWNTVQDHGGWITVKSGKKGTTFELHFPVTREKLPVKTKPTKIEDLTGNGENILVVDDEPLQRDIASQILTTLSYNVVSVGSGEDAIDHLEDNDVDLVVLDMIMEPGINGRKTYEEMIKIKPGQKAIITSGFSENKEVKKAQDLGAGQFIKKPYMLKQIGVAVKQALHS